MTKGQPQRPRNEPHGFACSPQQPTSDHYRSLQHSTLRSPWRLPVRCWSGGGVGSARSAWHVSPLFPKGRIMHPKGELISEKPSGRGCYVQELAAIIGLPITQAPTRFIVEHGHHPPPSASVTCDRRLQSLLLSY